MKLVLLAVLVVLSLTCVASKHDKKSMKAHKRNHLGTKSNHNKLVPNERRGLHLRKHAGHGQVQKPVVQQRRVVLRLMKPAMALGKRVKLEQLTKKWFAKMKALKVHKKAKGHLKHPFQLMKSLHAMKRGHARRNRIQQDIARRLEHDQDVYADRRQLHRKIHHLTLQRKELREYIGALRRLEHLRKRTHGDKNTLKHQKRGHTSKHHRSRLQKHQ